MPAPTNESLARQQMAFELRQRGYRWAEVARNCGYASTGAAQYAVDAYTRRMGATPAQVAQAVNAAVTAVFAPRFGVEIEVRRPAGQWNLAAAQDTIADAFVAAGLNARRSQYTHDVTEHWKITTDASSDIEVVSPILQGEDGMRQVRLALRALREVGCTVSHAEGLHVHVEARNLTPDQRTAFVRTYANRRRTIERFIAAHRTAGSSARQWCRSLTGRSLDLAEAIVRQQRSISYRDNFRYHDVNVCSFVRHGTIEFRAHEGSLNGRKVLGWIGLLLGIAQAVQAGVELPNGLRMLDVLVSNGYLTQVRADNLRRFGRNI